MANTEISFFSSFGQLEKGVVSTWLQNNYLPTSKSFFKRLQLCSSRSSHNSPSCFRPISKPNLLHQVHSKVSKKIKLHCPTHLLILIQNPWNVEFINFLSKCLSPFGYILAKSNYYFICTSDTKKNTTSVPSREWESVDL